MAKTKRSFQYEGQWYSAGDEFPDDAAGNLSNPGALLEGYVDTKAEGAYDGMKKDELVAECEKRGLPVSGTKEELVARLVESDGNS